MDNPQRLQSLDALRGFDMFWITGGGGLFKALAALTGWGALEWWAAQLSHAEWHGLTAEDMIFPLFLFIAGVSFPFSMAKSLQKGLSDKTMYFRIIRRGLTLVLFGILYNDFLQFDMEDQRYASVLGRIGLAWMFAALIFFSTKKTSVRTGWFGALLVVYWLLLAFIPAPDFPNAEKFSMEGNLTSYIDRILLPGRLYLDIHDPEGILGIVPAISTALLGMLTGQFLRNDKEKISGLKKSGYMAAVGAILIIIGVLWNGIFPINKNLWSSSFVCAVGGISLLLLALFYLIIDVWEYRKWAFYFKIIGLNSITIYMAGAFINFKFTTNALFGGVIGLFPENWAPLMSAFFYCAVIWFFLYFLYRQKIFLKV